MRPRIRMIEIFNWKRYWCPREGTFNLSDNGYLVDPESDISRYLPTDVRPYSEISAFPCLVLLGEPGIGKTTALREVEEWEARDYQVLKLDLGEFSSDSRLYQQFFESPRITDWCSGSHILSIILDGLDECRINGIVKLLSRELVRLPTERMRLRITCRTAQWPITLEKALISGWSKGGLSVFELAPLTRLNVVEAAVRSGIQADAFINEVARIHAQPLAIKPVTLLFLINHYLRNKCLPNDEASLYFDGCYRLCEDTQERLDSGAEHVCDAAQRFAIAQRIAYFTIFGGKYSVWIGSNDGSMPTEDISMLDLFGEEKCDSKSFNVDEVAIRDTINTGLFTSRGAYRMGWAHQTYAEYLASQYVVNNLATQQRRSLLLFSDEVGSGVVPQLSEVAARVALTDESLFQDMLKTSPDVLMRSDVATANDMRREALLAALLDKFAAVDLHYRDVVQAERFRYLCHPNIIAQLQPYIVDSKKCIDVRLFALNVLGECGAGDLNNVLIDIALNKAEHIAVRCHSLDVVIKYIDHDIALRLRPLAEDVPDDPDRQIKGIVLHALWPKYMKTEEMFTLLTPKVDRLYCSYDVFMTHHICSLLSREDMPIALEWALSKVHRHGLYPQFEKLLNEIIIKSWAYLDDPTVIIKLVDLLWAILTSYHGHIFHNVEYQQAGFLADDVKRRALLVAMLSKIVDIDKDTHFLNCTEIPIIRPTDFEWYIEMTLSAKSDHEAHIWARLCRNSYRIDIVAATDAILTVYDKCAVIRDEFKSIVEPVALGSPDAAKLKEEYDKYHIYTKKREEPPFGPRYNWT